MMYNDLEKMVFSQLTDLEKHEAGNKLTVNYNTLILQLNAMQQFELAGVLQIAIAIYQLSPNRLIPLIEYMTVLHQSAIVDAQLRLQNAKIVEGGKKQQEENKDDSIDVDLGDKEQ